MLFLGDYFFNCVLPKAFKEISLEDLELYSTTESLVRMFKAYSFLNQELGNRFWEAPDCRIVEDVTDFSSYIVPIIQYFVPAWDTTIYFPFFKFYCGDNQKEIPERIGNLLQDIPAFEPFLALLELDPRVIRLHELPSEQKTSLLNLRSYEDQMLEEKWIDALVKHYAFTPAHLKCLLESFSESFQDLFYKSSKNKQILIQRDLFFQNKAPEWGVIVASPTLSPLLGHIRFPEVQESNPPKYLAQVHLLSIHKDSLFLEKECSTTKEAEEFLLENLKEDTVRANTSKLRFILKKVIEEEKESDSIAFIEHDNYFKQYWLAQNNPLRHYCAEYTQPNTLETLLNFFHLLEDSQKDI